MKITTSLHRIDGGDAMLVVEVRGKFTLKIPIGRAMRARWLGFLIDNAEINGRVDSWIGLARRRIETERERGAWS